MWVHLISLSFTLISEHISSFDFMVKCQKQILSVRGIVLPCGQYGRVFLAKMFCIFTLQSENNDNFANKQNIKNITELFWFTVLL